MENSNRKLFFDETMNIKPPTKKTAKEVFVAGNNTPLMENQGNKKVTGVNGVMRDEDEDIRREEIKYYEQRVKYYEELIKLPKKFTKIINKIIKKGYFEDIKSKLKVKKDNSKDESTAREQLFGLYFEPKPVHEFLSKYKNSTNEEEETNVISDFRYHILDGYNYLVKKNIMIIKGILISI